MRSLALVMVLLFLVQKANAQAHISKSEYARYNCRLAPKGSNNSEGKLMCPACDKENEAARQRKIEADNAANQANNKRLEQEKAAKALAFKKNQEAKVNGNKATEVIINGNNSNGAVSDNNTPGYIMSAPNAAANTSADATALAYQAVGEQLANTIVSLFSPSAAKLQKRAAEAAASEKERSDKEANYKKSKYDEFRMNYWPLMDKAKKGDENAQMILYFSSYELSNTELVPQRKQWLEKAVRNNNQDAMLEYSGIKEIKTDKKEKYESCLYWVQKAANLGNVDAMMLLANWYNRANTVSAGYTLIGGEDPSRALEWYKKAAAKGSPNAMGCLGMIYKYGRVQDLSGSGTNFLKKYYVKYDVLLDEKVAFEWFAKSLQPDYKESLFARSINITKNDFSNDYFSYFNPFSYLELARIYKAGKIVLKDKLKAKEFEQKAEAYTTEMMNRQKFSILFR